MTPLFRGPITGRKFFAIIASFFVVIITVNVALAVSAVRTFPGLEVANSYVASQSFDLERAAQERLGWDVSATLRGGDLVLAITGPDGAPVGDAAIDGTFGRATSVRDDQRPAFGFDGQAWRAPVVAGPGNWNFRLEAVAADGTPFHQRVVVQ